MHLRNVSCGMEVLNVVVCYQYLIMTFPVVVRVLAWKICTAVSKWSRVMCTWNENLKNVVLLNCFLIMSYLLL